MPLQLVLARHGQSEWNKQNRFTGWEDPPLTDKGRAEAVATAQILQSQNAVFDVAFTSYLRRAAETLWLVQQHLEMTWIPVNTDWRLNERHYGALQGETKTVAAQQYGEEQVHKWRRGYDSRPPKGGGAFAPDKRYANITVPQGESLEDTRERVWQCYCERILPLLTAGKRVLIVAHGNSLRALIMKLDNISADNVAELEIPTGGAVVYDVADDGTPRSPHRHLSG